MDPLSRYAALAFAAVGFSAPNAFALEIGGALQAHVAQRIKDGQCPEGVVCDTPFNEQRFQLKLEDKLGDASFFGKVDVAHDAALHENRHEVRELYADYNGSNTSVRAGRQIITWGVGDLVFINDVFPKNYNALFSGQPIEYLKRGSDAVKVNAYPSWGGVEFIASTFRPDRTPDPRRFIIEGLPAATPRSEEDPSQTEFGLRLSKMFGNWDGSAYFYRGHYHEPTYSQIGNSLVGRHPRLNTYGASLVGPALGGVISTEIGYYDSVKDQSGVDPTIENSQTKALIGYSREIAEDTTVGVQYFTEYLNDYGEYRNNLPPGATARKRLKETATVRFTQRYLRQTLTFNVFAFLGVSDHDRYVTPSLRYAFSDAVSGEIGANVFSGRASGSFGALDRNDNVYLLLRYSF